MKYLYGVLLLVVSLPTYANYWCSGKVEFLGTDDRLVMSNGHGKHRICNIVEDKCKAWFSLLTTAKLTGKSVTVYYSSTTIQGEQTNGECANIGNWVNPSDPTYFVQLNN